jgi:hypothetical protein
MKRRRGLQRNVEASGYLESILAIMVISSAVTLVLASISAVDFDYRQSEYLEHEAEAWRSRIIGTISDDGSTIEKKNLDRLKDIPWELGAGMGMRAEIHVIGSETSRLQLITLGQIPELVDTCYSLMMPINFIGDGPEVMAAMLVVVVW